VIRASLLLLDGAAASREAKEASLFLRRLPRNRYSVEIMTIEDPDTLRALVREYDVARLPALVVEGEGHNLKYYGAEGILAGVKELS